MATITETSGIATRKRPIAWLWVALWLIFFVIGSMAVIKRLSTGHTAAAYGSYVTWGLWVAAYIYFIGLSAGAFLLSSLVFVFQLKRLEIVGKMALYVAAVTLLMALLSIWFDIGHMSRFYYIFTSPNFTSMMAWMVWLYTAYFLLVLAELWFVLRPDLTKIAGESGVRGGIARFLLFGKVSLSEEDIERGRRALRVLGAIGIPLAIAFHGGVGALFATVAARPYWHTPLYPILFLTGALVSGGALLTGTIAFFWPNKNRLYRDVVSFMGRIVLGILLFDLLLEWAEYSIPMWYAVGHEYDLMTKVLFGPYWWVFWILHIVLGSFIPIYLLVGKSKNPMAVGIAGLLIATTFMAVRLNIVVPGLIEPQLHGLERAYQDSRLTFEYVPALFEWQVVLFVITIGVALFYLGYRLLPIVDREEQHEVA